MSKNIKNINQTEWGKRFRQIEYGYEMGDEQ